MLTPLILFLGLTVATAIIAYWSDNLGKKLGKKRVSLFGLRPRTTATVLTISSSWVIMIVTLVVLLIVVTPLRHALFRYDRESAQHRLDQLSYDRDRAEYRRDIKNEQGKLKGMRQQYVTANNALERARTNLKTARKDVDEAKARATAALAGERSAALRAANARQSALTAQRSASQAQSRLANARIQFKAAQARVTAARQNEIAARGRAEAANRNLQATQRELSGARSNLSSVRSDLGEAQAQLREAGVNLTNAGKRYVDALRNQVAAESKTVLAERQLAALKAQQAELLDSLTFYYSAADSLGRSDIAVPVGRTFAAGIIESGKSEKRIEENLRQLFAKGSQAINSPPIELPEFVSLDLLPLPQVVDGKVEFMEGDAVYERLAREIAKSDDATSVRLVAVRNVTQNEIEKPTDPSKKVIIDARFVVVQVATAFRAGEELADISVDGTSGDAGVFNKLLALTDAGRNVALDRKVNPPQSPQEPNFYAAGTNVALFTALRKIEASGKTVKVRLVAADDLLTVEPLRVRFEIDGEAETPSGT